MEGCNLKLKIGFCLIFSVVMISASSVAAQAATLFLSPSTGSYGAGDTFNVAVKLNTGGKSANTAESTMTFDPTKLSVQSISKIASVFSLWVQEPSFSNQDGLVSFAGGKPSPGYSGSSGTIIVIAFKGLTSGTANVNFSSASILADDGLGTNILSNLIPGAYTITAKTINTAPSVAPATPDVPASTSGIPETPVVASATHSDENQWYPNNSPEFTWQLPLDAAKVSYGIDKNPTANPEFIADTLVTEDSFPNLEDGIWYFHINFKNQYGWGKLTHRKVLIDTVPPTIFKIIVDKKGELTNPSPVLYFESTDSSSGIEYYEVTVDREKKLTAKAKDASIADIKRNPFQLSSLTPGMHLIEVTAFDAAGNFSLTTAEIEITPIDSMIELTKVPISIRIGEPLEIEGKVTSDLIVRIYIQKTEAEPVLEKVKADSEGKFKLAYSKSLAKGDYLIWAQAENEKGALSNPTKKYSLEVGLPPFLKIGKITLDYISIVATLIVLIVGILAIIFYGWYGVSMWRKKMRKESREVQESVAKAFRALREEVQEQVEVMDKKPGLTKSEKRLRDKLKEALDISEKFINKEIEDVERELE